MIRAKYDRIAQMISYIVRVIRWSEVSVITLSSVHCFNKAGARCSTNLALLKCWGVEIVDFDLRLWLDLQHGNRTVKVFVFHITYFTYNVRHTAYVYILYFRVSAIIHFAVEEVFACTYGLYIYHLRYIYNMLYRITQSIKTHFYSAICRKRIRGVYLVFSR